jgi:hypothetical protein
VTGKHERQEIAAAIAARCIHLYAACAQGVEALGMDSLGNSNGCKGKPFEVGSKKILSA